MKSMEISSKYDILNHEWTLNKLRISSWTPQVSGSWEVSNIPQNVWLAVFYLTVTLPLTGFLTRYSEFEGHGKKKQENKLQF